MSAPLDCCMGGGFVQAVNTDTFEAVLTHNSDACAHTMIADNRIYVRIYLNSIHTYSCLWDRKHMNCLCDSTEQLLSTT